MLPLFALSALLATSLAAKSAQSVQTFEALSCSTAFGPNSAKPVPHTTKTVTSQLLVTANIIASQNTNITTTSSTPDPASSTSSTTNPQNSTLITNRAAAATKSYPTQVLCTKTKLLVSTTTITIASTPSSTSTPSYFNLQIRGSSYDGKFAVLDTYGDLPGDYYLAGVDGQSGASPFELRDGALVWSNGGGIPWYANQEPRTDIYTDALLIYFSTKAGGGLDGQAQPTCIINGDSQLACTNSLVRSIFETCLDNDDNADRPLIQLSTQVDTRCSAVSLVVVPMELS